MRVSMLIARALALDYLKAANAKAMLFAVQNAVGACRIVEVESKLKQLWLSSGPQLGFREETPSEISSKEVALTKRRLKTVTDAKA